MRRKELRGPLADSYPAAVVLVVCALVPFLLLTSAMTPLGPVVGKGAGLSKRALELTLAMSDAAYAFGTVLAVQFAQHLRGRRMLILYVSAFVVACALSTWAPAGGVFVGAYVVEGLCTSLMLIAAVPPLVTGWPASKMPWTGAIMNLCIFGAVAAGPAIGGLSASLRSWRPLFAVVGGIAMCALVFAILTFEDQEPQDRSAPWDAIAVGLAGAGCAAAFFGAGELEARRSASAAAVAPLAAGVLMIVVLVVHQYRMRHPLMPVRQLATTLPVMGVTTAICASAAAFGLTALVLTALAKTTTPGHAALVFLPELGAAVLTAAIFGVLFRTRFVPVLALSGLVSIVAAAALLTPLPHVSDARVAAAAGLVGLGVGASVSPALFIAGFSLRSAQIQRVFALIELLRGVGAFLFAPILLFLALTIGATAAAGARDAVWICLAVAAAGFVGSSLLYALGAGRLQEPDLERWNEGEPAWDSPPLLARARVRALLPSVREWW